VDPSGEKFMNPVRQQTLEKYLDYTKRLYDLLGAEPTIGVSYMKIARAAEIPPWMMINLKTLLEELGHLKTTIVYNPVVDGKTVMGRQATWQLKGTADEARNAIQEWEKKGEAWEYEKRSTYVVKAPVRPRKPVEIVATELPETVQKQVVEDLNDIEPVVTVAQTEKEETRAIAGPEPKKTFTILAPLRKDEPRAFIEAARQYANRQTAVEKEYQSLVTMGLQVDRELFFKAISLPRDETLETVSLVLPLITELENKNTHLLDQLNAARDRVKDYAELKGNYERLQKLWNQRIADRVKAS
jgi:hypothetical protein